MPTPPELLARVPIFVGLSPLDLAELAEATRLERFDPGTSICEIGEPGRSLYVLTEGNVNVRHADQAPHFELAQFGPGDFFGEMALLDKAPRSATVRATTAVEALVLDRADFRRLLASKPDLALRLLETLSHRIRSADELIHGLTHAAIRDPLTGLLNKQAFTDRLAEEIARTRRYGGTFSLILLDFDEFEAVNVAVGRDQGDRILEWTGRLLHEHTRGSDVPFRLDEDAFTVLCPRTAGDCARTVARRLSALIDEAEPPIDADVELSVSTGTASCPSDAYEALALFQAAERALQGGRA